MWYANNAESSKKESGTKLVLIQTISKDKMRLTQYRGRKQGSVSELDISDAENMEEARDLIESFRLEEVK